MRTLVQFSANHPRLVIGLTFVFTMLFAAQFPKIKSWFAPHPDMILLGVRNNEGIFTPPTLRRIAATTEAILKISAYAASHLAEYGKWVSRRPEFIPA